jgi:hypothetical protein
MFSFLYSAEFQPKKENMNYLTQKIVGLGIFLRFLRSTFNEQCCVKEVKSAVGSPVVIKTIC